VINDINISVWIKKKHLPLLMPSTNFLRTDGLRNSHRHPPVFPW
jgi:hypothetical protein